MPKRKSPRAIRRAYALGYDARRDGNAADLNPYSFTAAGLGGPWLVGWQARDREEGGQVPRSLTKARHTTTPIQRSILLEMAALAAFIDVSIAPLSTGAHGRSYALRTDLTKIREVHVRTLRELRGKGYVAMRGRRFFISVLGMAALPEVRAIIHLKKTGGTSFTRSTSAAVLSNLLMWRWVLKDKAGGFALTAEGEKAVGRMS